LKSIVLTKPGFLFGLSQVLLLDEPTSALDPISTHHIEQSVLELKRSKGLTVIMVSHSFEQVKRIADYVCLIVAGELLEVFKPTELDSVTHPQAQEYLEAAQRH
jgi:ABC-type phosphate transport system ATPase subunit